jgi:hypothetical protein
MDFTSLTKMFQHIENKAASVLKKEIADLVVETMQEKIEEEVYSVYEPKEYVRQRYQGGLQDPRNIEITMIGDNTISVENIRFDGDREVAEIVESGQGYTYDFPYAGVPRPFTQATRDELNQSGKLKVAMSQGLRKRGFDTKG